MRAKIGIIGTGGVGMSVALSLLHFGAAGELILNDARPDVAEGEAMDLVQGSSFYPTARVRAGAIEEMLDCDAVVVTAGVGRAAPGQSRLELLATNAGIVTDDRPAAAGRARHRGHGHEPGGRHDAGDDAGLGSPAGARDRHRHDARLRAAAAGAGARTRPRPPLDPRPGRGRARRLRGGAVVGRAGGRAAAARLVRLGCGAPGARDRGGPHRGLSRSSGARAPPRTPSGWSPRRCSSGCCAAPGAC